MEYIQFCAEKTQTTHFSGKYPGLLHAWQGKGEWVPLCSCEILKVCIEELGEDKYGRLQDQEGFAGCPVLWQCAESS